MSKINLEGFPQAVAGLHDKPDVMQRLLLNVSNNSKAVPEHPSPGWDYLPSIAALADFLECSYRTALRFKKAGLIRFTREGTKVKFLITDVLDAIEKHDRVGKYIDRFCEKYPPAGSPPVPKKDPKIRIETGLFPERFMFIKIRHQGWGCTVCTVPELWDNQPRIRALVNQIIKEQNKCKPFRISPL
jgi:hypothetical protein